MSELVAMDKKELEKQMQRDGLQKPGGKPMIPDRPPVKKKGEGGPETSEGPPMPVPLRGPFIEERLATIEQKIDTIGRGQAESMAILRALGIRAKVLQVPESGKGLVIVTPAPKKRKRK